MKERRLWIVLATLTVFAIAGGAQAQGASELRVGWLADPFNIELNRQRLAMYPLNANVCEPLFRLTHDFRVAPWLGVRSVYVGNNTFRIRLRQGVRFHDGSPFTAETVKYSLDRTVRARIGYSFLAEGSTRVIDGETVEVRPTRPNLRLVEQLVHPTYAIVALNNDPRMHPVCTGPFRFREYIAQERLAVEANPDYWQSPPKVGRITFRFFPDDNTRLLALLSGQIDLAVELPRSTVRLLRQRRDLQVVTAKPGAVMMMTANVRGKEPYTLLRDVRLRRAVAMAIDRTTLIRRVMEGLAIAVNTVNPPEILGPYAPLVKGIPYDPEGAVRQLEEAGWQRGPDGVRTKDGRRLQLVLLMSHPSDIDPQIPQYLQGQLRRVGIDLRLDLMEAAVTDARLDRGEFDLFLWTPNQNDANPVFLLTLWWFKGAIARAGPYVYAGPEFDAIIDQALRTASIAEVRRLAADAMRLLIDQEAIAIPLAGIYRIFGVRAEVDGFRPHPARLHADWTTVSVRR